MVDLNTVEFLIKQLQDKSSFEKFYQNKLARRLLDCANVNMKMENEMINIIKVISILYNILTYINQIFNDNTI